MCKNKLDVDQIPLTESNDGSYTVHCTSMCRYFLGGTCNFEKTLHWPFNQVYIGMHCPVYWHYYE